MASDQKLGYGKVATLGGGCFWCLEAVFADLAGVEKVLPGYCGGVVAHPSYEEVCTGRTGHAEAVQVTYDPGRISYEELLTAFFAIHDPTTLNRQGGDIGSQYRSVIFFHSPEQEGIAHKMISELEKKRVWGEAPIVTEVVPFEVFYPAEDYHREYFARNVSQPYCQAVVAPKVAKFRRQFADRLSHNQS